MANNAGSSKTDTAVKLVLIFFIALLSFSMGTFVGKQVSDSEHSHRQTRATDQYSGRNTASTAVDIEIDEPSISEEEVNSLTEEFLAEEKKDGEHEDVDGYKKYGSDTKSHADTAHTNNTHGTNEMLKDAIPVANSANRVAQGKAPEADPKMRNIASTLPSVASSSIGKYTVQIASYATQPEADKHVATIKSKGYSAFSVPATIKGKTWFRVSVGLFTNQKTAMKFQEELRAQAGVSSSIVQKIVN